MLHGHIPMRVMLHMSLDTRENLSYNKGCESGNNLAGSFFTSLVMSVATRLNTWMQTVPGLGCTVPALPAARVLCPPSEQ